LSIAAYAGIRELDPRLGWGSELAPRDTNRRAVAHGEPASRAWTGRGL